MKLIKCLKNSNFCHLFVCLLSFFTFEISGHAQDAGETNWDDGLLESELYEINLIKFERVRMQQKALLDDSTGIKQMNQLTEHFTNLAAAGEYEDANVILETAIEMVENLDQDISLPEIDTMLEMMLLSEATADAKEIKWRSELTVGTDLWKQEFEFSSPDFDSTIIENMGNPYARIQTGFDWSGTATDISLNGSIKTSRDYISSGARFDFEKKLHNNLDINFRNNYESTNYQQEFDLSYWQNQTTARLEVQNLHTFSFHIEDEILIRRNEPHNSIYSDFLQNQFGIYGTVNAGAKMYLYATYQLENRVHSGYSDKDYAEQAAGFNYFGMFSSRINLNADTQYRYRNYHNTFTDTTYYVDYEELLLQAKFALRLTNFLSVQMKHKTELRRYELITPMTPAYLEWEFQPGIIYYFAELASVEAGYVYSCRTYRQPQFADRYSILEEDYYSHGFSISLDFLKLNRFMINITDAYTIKRYPNSAASEIEHFTLYTDRNINSLLCYISYFFHNNFELGLIANFDDDRDPIKRDSDTRTTMLAVELTYLF